MIHQDALTMHSTLFRAALEGQFREGSEKLIRMPEADAEIFAIYSQWAYSRALVLLEHDEVAKDTTVSKRAELMVHTYIMADQVGNTKLQNQVVDEYAALLRKEYTGPSYTCLHLIYDRLPDKSGLRKFIIDWYLAYVQIKWLENNMNSMPDAFVKDLAIGFAKAAGTGGRRRDTRAPCAYHAHDCDNPLCLDMKIKKEEGDHE